jgi:uncharacterized protein
MPSLEQVTSRRAEILRLAERYHTSEIKVFGSVVRGEARPDSDIDFVITPGPSCTLFDLGGLHEDLEEMLGCAVDVVTPDGLKPGVRERVLKEAVPV